MDNKAESNQRINLFLQVLQIQMESCNVALGWDEKQRKLVLLDVETGNLARVDLTELNKCVGNKNDTSNRK